MISILLLSSLAFPVTSWWWQLQGEVDINRKEKIVDIDLFANDPKKFKSEVICYFSAGSFEVWLPDADKIPKKDRGLKMSGWDEQWLNVKSPEVRAVMFERLKLAKNKGCSGVEPDNVDGFTNKTGFNIKRSDSVDYLKYLSNSARALKLKIALKNSPELVEELEPFFDFAIVESCETYDECERYLPFIRARKNVLQAEYTSFNRSWCNKAKGRGYSLLFFKTKKLDGSDVMPCL